ncbi:MAG: DUF3795 domain-containing protein [Candidatus Hodarchaeota archaeon]
MVERIVLNPCGATCIGCPSFLGQDEERPCTGCLSTKGNPWWGECKLYKCTVEKSVSHCGVCSDFPCERLVAHFDPDNPSGQRNAIVRTGLLAYRTKHGEDKAIKLRKKLDSL